LPKNKPKIVSQTIRDHKDPREFSAYFFATFTTVWRVATKGLILIGFSQFAGPMLMELFYHKLARQHSFAVSNVGDPDDLSCGTRTPSRSTSGNGKRSTRLRATGTAIAARAR
jgi:hypothetical protein